MHNTFYKFAHHIAKIMGSPKAFLIAVFLIAVWLLSGFVFGLSNTWQLIINTATTIVTFLMVFIIQNTQNRDTQSMELKLDELIRAVKGARNSLIDIEEMTDKELDELQEQFRKIRIKRSKSSS